MSPKIMELDAELTGIEKQINRKCQEIPNAVNILKISGIGENTLSGILADMGDISRFDDTKKIQKLSGLSLVACGSGKHKRETKISHRGLRYWLFQVAKLAVAHAEEFKELHMYYTKRADNPLKKLQSLIVIACKSTGNLYVVRLLGVRRNELQFCDLSYYEILKLRNFNGQNIPKILAIVREEE